MAAESRLLEVRRTLVLGLGTTGKEVAEQVAEHLTWQYGGFERAAWVRLLVLETEPPASPRLGDRVLWGGMTREEYAPYVDTPRTAGADFNFYDWQDSATLSAIDEPSTGAGNCRMLGRLCLFHPRTYEKLRMRVSRDIAHLQQLTPQGVAEQLGRPELNVQFHPDLVVYAVGTLCGGTCSGGAADLGYLIDVWSNGAAKRQAIFTLPHPALGRPEAPRFKKNAYYALKELNHYQLSENAWVQRLPGYGAPFVKRNRPYDILRVVMPGGAATEDVTRLNATIAQYLAASVGPAGSQIAASDVDASSFMESSERVGFMRPLFSTMGVAALEYPGEHIQRAATSRLLATAYERWCRHAVDPAKVDEALRMLGGTDFDAMLARLTQGAEKSAMEALQEEFRRPEPPGVHQIRQILRAQDNAMEAIQPPEGDAASSGATTLLQAMQSNHERALAGVEGDVNRIVDRLLFDLDGGPGFLAEALKQYARCLEDWAVQAQETQRERQQEARTMREILDQQLAELEHQQNSPALWRRREKLRESWERTVEKIRPYLEAQTRAQAVSHLQRGEMVRQTTEQYRKVTALLLRRLEALQAAFQQEATELDGQWRKLAASSPAVNGRAYFAAEPPAARGTVTEEYFNLLKQRTWPDEPVTGWDEGGKEEAALREVVRTLAPLREELSRDGGASAFDPRPGAQTARQSIPAPVLAAAEAAARGFFGPLRGQVHIADKASEADLSAVLIASEPQLRVSATQVSDQLSDARGVTPMAPNLAFMGLEGNRGNLRPAVARVVERVRNSLELRRDVIDSDDPFRLLLIREKHGFTLGQMEGVVRSNPHDLTALQSAEHRDDFRFWHTRRDIDWADPLVPPLQVEGTEEAWLMVILLGHPAEPALAWLPATAGDIEAEGWYQVTAGEFRVFYPPGVDAPEKEARLPLRFSDAVGKLLSRDYATLRRTLSIRFSAYRDRCGDASIVRVVDRALQSFDVFGVGDLDSRAAEKIVRRFYRRRESLTRAFFDFKTESLAGANSEFAHLFHIQGEPIPGRNTVYPADAYYCAEGHLLGSDIRRLLDGMFKCPVCNTEERYWP